MKLKNEISHSTIYLACHGENHGAGFFSNEGFNTAEEAQVHIDSRADGVGDEYKEYWEGIRDNMFILKRESTFTPVEPIDLKSILPVNQVKNILEEHTKLNLKDADMGTLMSILNLVKIMQIPKVQRDVLSKFASMDESK